MGAKAEIERCKLIYYRVFLNILSRANAGSSGKLFPGGCLHLVVSISHVLLA